MTDPSEGATYTDTYTWSYDALSRLAQEVYDYGNDDSGGSANKTTDDHTEKCERQFTAETQRAQRKSRSWAKRVGPRIRLMGPDKCWDLAHFFAGWFQAGVENPCHGEGVVLVAFVLASVLAKGAV